MSDPFTGEIRMFAGNFAPRGWAFCDGQLVSVSQFDALSTLFGTTYGGDGRVSFALPDMRGRIPIHAGNGAGPGLLDRALGSSGGAETETLTVGQLPTHTHRMQADTTPGTEVNPANVVLAASANVQVFRPLNQFQLPNNTMATAAVTGVGGGESHTNVMPFLCVNFIVCLTGIFPSRN